MPTSSAQPENSKIHETITRLIADLANHDGLKRQTARRTLVRIGDSALGALIYALQSQRTTVRWEAAKALGAINNPVAAPALVEAMNDDDFGVRWLAAEGLIALRCQGLPSLLTALTEYPDAAWLWESAHHVFKVLADDGLADLLAPVLDALDHMVSAETISLAARSVLDRLCHDEQADSA